MLRLRWIAGRLLNTIPVLLGVTLLTFFLLERLPGSAARQMLGPEATPAQVAALEKRLGLDRPATERYGHWVGAAVTGDLGQSMASRQSVAALLRERFAVTLQLVFCAIFLSLMVALPAAILAARYPDSLADRAMLTTSMAGLSVPGYVLALVLVLAFCVHLGWLPAIGYAPPADGLADNLRSLALPSLAIALPLAGLYLRVLRADLLQKLTQEEYVTAAIAKGAGPWRVILHHALRNSAVGVVTLVSLNLGVLLGGTVVIEQIFALPGLGQLLLQSVTIRDAPVMQGVVLVLGLSIVAANLACDLLCGWLDPRSVHGSQARA